jgi:putative flippase GtrA
MPHIPPTIHRFIRFGLVGAVAFAVSMGLTALLVEVLGLSEELAFGITLVVVLIGGFMANRHLVFEAADANLRRQGTHYALAALTFRALQYLSFLAIHTALGVPYLLAIFIVLSAWFVIKYAYYGKAVFRPAGTESSS